MWFDYLLPYRGTLPGGPKPLVSWTLLALNALVFVWELGLAKTGIFPFFIRDFAVTPEKLSGNPQDSWPTLISHTFFHQDLLHAGGNLYYLWTFGHLLEKRLGNLPFLFSYFLWGAFAAFFQIFFEAQPSAHLFGASGAISGILGAYFVLRPLERVGLALPTFGFTRPLEAKVPIFLFLGFWFLLQMARGIGSLTTPPAEASSVAYWAHTGGFAAGALTSYLWTLLRGDGTGEGR